jgi:hypothetical protein
MRPVRLLAVSIPAAACLATALPALGAVDDQFAPVTPAAAPAGIVASARRLIDDTMEKQRAVVAVLRDNVVSRVVAGSWRLSLGTPYMPRATALVSRPVPNDFADGALSASTDADALDVALGARWRVLHGDANSHVPAAAWMPDLRSADAHAAALRPTMNLSGEWALPDDFSLGVMPGLAIDYSALGRRQATGTFAVTLGKSWSPQWRTFVDMARDRLAAVQITGVSSSVDAGITFVAGPSTQIDFAVTRGLSDTAPPFQAGLGLSSRF